MKRAKLWIGLLALALWSTTVAAEVTVGVTNVTAKQRYPWNGLVDIDCTVTCSAPASNVYLYATARDTATGKSLPMRTVRLENGAFGEDLVVKTRDLSGGKVRLVWDAGKDAAGTVSDAVTVEVQALAGEGLYLVLDLSAGSGDAATYPVSFLGAEPQGGWPDEYKTTKLVLRRINPGTYTMGCETSEVGYTGYEAVPHEVTITQPFYIGVFEVTQKQWELVMGTKPSYFSNASCYEKRPVEQVSWNTIRGTSSTYNWPTTSEVAATSFLGKLRAKAVGGPGLLWDLPTEAQWEYACRAGTTTALNSGKNLTGTGSCPNMAEVGRYWYNGGQNYSSSCDTAAGTAEVGSYLPNAWGLYDMHGNVWEWTLDWYQSRSGFTSDPATDPNGPTSGSSRVRRGGSWSYNARYCRSAYRYDYSPSSSYGGDGGFRLACVPGL